ncbi:MAG: ComEC/Rec2 family competence protein [Patescibacteria group bacterium]
MILPLLSALSFFAGVLLATFSEVGAAQWAWPVALLLCFKKKGVGLLVLAFLFGVWRMDFYEENLEQGQTGLRPGGEVELEGVIVAEVDVRSDHQKITVETEQGRVLVKAGQYEDLHYGDRVKVLGELERPEAGDSYANYLFRYGILMSMDRAQVEVLEPAGFSLRGFLYDFKERVQMHINRLYFEPEASLVSGLLLGSRKGMSEELTRDFQAVGLTHIVAVSGYNISLVIACIFALFSFVPMKRRVIVSVISVALFVLFVGASAAAVRAGIMGSLAMWGLYTGRRSQAFFALLWSAVVMILWNPAILPFDIGFQLSFVSTLGLLVFTPMLEKIFPLKVPFLREALLLTLSAQLATFPFMLFYFGRLSLISPVANLVVAPLLPFSMLFSGLSLVGGMPFAVLATVFLKGIIFSTRVLAKIPYADVPLQIGLHGFLLTLSLLSFLVLIFYKPKLVRAFLRGSGEVFSKVPRPQSQRHETQ